MTQEINGATNSESVGYGYHIEDDEGKKAQGTYRGYSTQSTIQPLDPNQRRFAPYPYHPQMPPSDKSEKNIALTYILLITGWEIGLHDFYAGRTGRGILKIVL
ncbi:MAG: TM2 domain-containing protein, partial [Simkaniaceae bacterium]|nr:TM2 domain-containing protein [Simkaniaceae bacterium]